MIRFEQPVNLNGGELREELKAAGILISDKLGSISIENDGLYLDISKASQAKAISVVAAHNGTMIAPEPTLQDKLKSVGLSINELKLALGLE
jgi:hypothetical protein